MWSVQSQELGILIPISSFQCIRYINEVLFIGHRSNNFIIGLTDVSPNVTAPTLWNYDVCGQYPGEVGDGATVYLQCKCNVPPRRYLIVQTPPNTDHMNFCEISVYIRSTSFQRTRSQLFTSTKNDTKTNKNLVSPSLLTAENTMTFKPRLGSLKVIGNVTIRYSACDFLLMFSSNYGSISLVSFI